MLLGDDASVYGKLNVDAAGLRWFSAIDLIDGTTTWRETKFERLGNKRKAATGTSTVNDTTPTWTNGHRFPPTVIVTCSSNDEGTPDSENIEEAIEDVSEHSGAELWPMPPRVGIVACHSGAESSSSEPFGLTTACLEAGAELVFATRWTMYVDMAFWIVRRLYDHSDKATPFYTLSQKVDDFLRSENPIADMGDWKRECLEQWRKAHDGINLNTDVPASFGAAPITWAGLTVFRAPNRKEVD